MPSRINCRSLPIVESGDWQIGLRAAGDPGEEAIRLADAEPPDNGRGPALIADGGATQGPEDKVLIHLDQASQFTGMGWVAFLRAHRLKHSMSQRGNCHDNTVAESFFNLLKRERVRRRTYRTRGRGPPGRVRLHRDCSTTPSESTSETACCHLSSSNGSTIEPPRRLENSGLFTCRRIQ